MSKRNGDRARFDRERKKKIVLRESSQKLQKELKTRIQGQGENTDTSLSPPSETGETK